MGQRSPQKMSINLHLAQAKLHIWTIPINNHEPHLTICMFSESALQGQYQLYKWDEASADLEPNTNVSCTGWREVVDSADRGHPDLATRNSKLIRRWVASDSDGTLDSRDRMPLYVDDTARMLVFCRFAA